MKSETNNKTKTMGVMIDGCGVAVPLAYVSAYDKARDRRVRKILSQAFKLRLMLERFMQETLSSMSELAALRDPKKFGIKGNFQCSSFDGLQQVEISQNYNIFLDERVATARDKMLGYVDRVLGRVNPKDAAALHVIIETSFRVGANGMLSKGKVFQLLAMNINDDDWRQAQELLRQSIKPSKGKQYLRVYSRPDHNHPWKQILLDLSDCWPMHFDSSFTHKGSEAANV